MNKTKINKTKQKNRFKKTKKNRKYYGGDPPLQTQTQIQNSFENKNGIIDSLNNKVSNILASTRKFITEKALRLAGLQSIQNTDSDFDNTNKEVNKNINQISNSASNIISDVQENVHEIGKDIVDVANKTSALFVENVNEVLGSPQVNENLNQAIENTKNIIENNLNVINKIASDPKLQQIADKSLENVSIYADKFIDVMDKPINNAIDKLNDAGERAVSGVLSGAVKVGTDVMAAVPGAGAIVETGKIINDASKAVGSVVEAGSESISTVSDLVSETSKNIKDAIKEIDDIKNQASQIADRTSNSIEEFVKPIQSNIQPIQSIEPIIKNDNIKGGTKKNVAKYRKTKRVRFVL
jgi:F0F1-type ATP synthase membrane subunit b/b'